MKFYLYICMTFPSQPNSEKFYVIIYCSYSIKYVLAVGKLLFFFVFLLIDHLYESVTLICVCVCMFTFFSLASNPNCEMIQIIRMTNAFILSDTK